VRREKERERARERERSKGIIGREAGWQSCVAIVRARKGTKERDGRKQASP